MVVRSVQSTESYSFRAAKTATFVPGVDRSGKWAGASAECMHREDYIIVVLAVIVFEPQGPVLREGIPRSNKPPDIIRNFAQSEAQIRAGDHDFPTIRHIGQHTDGAAAAGTVVLLIGGA